MKKKDVRIGCRYTAKVSGDMVPITITDRHCFGGWEARNEVTGRAIRIKTAGRLRGHSKGCPACLKARLYPVPCPGCRDKPLARAKCRRCGGTGTIRVTVPEE